MKKILNICLVSLLASSSLFMTSCNKDKESENISRVTTYADIALTGGAVYTIKLGSVTSYVDPGATAKDANGGPVTVETTKNTVNVNKIGSYVVEYKAVNADGFVSTNSRTVNVISASPIHADITGNYLRVANGRTATVSKLGEGFYEISDVWGSATSGGAPFPQPAKLLNFKGDSLLIVPSPTSFGNGSITGSGIILPNGDLSIDTDLGGASKRVNVWAKQ